MMAARTTDGAAADQDGVDADGEDGHAPCPPAREDLPEQAREQAGQDRDIKPC